MNYPFINFGTYQIYQKNNIQQSLLTAIKYNYLGIDTAQLYKNEKFIGDFFMDNQIDISNFWLTTKLHPKNNLKNENIIIDSIYQSLLNLNTKTIDLFLIHSPSTNNLKLWNILSQFKNQGIIKNIGVSNFNIQHLQDILNFSTQPIFTNQIEISPFNYLAQLDTINFMIQNNIIVSGHSSLTKGLLLDNQTLINIAEQYRKTPAQILLKWNLYKNIHIMPRSQQFIHIINNNQLDFTIDKEHLNILDNLNQNYFTHPQYKQMI